MLLGVLFISLAGLQEKLGDIVFVELPEVGGALTKGGGYVLTI